MRGTPEDTKLIVVPSRLVNRLRAVAGRHGIPLSSYTVEALEEAIRVEDLGASLSEAVDFYKLLQIQRGANIVHIRRSSLDHLIKELYQTKGEELRRIWYESGLWYGAYLRTKLKDDDVLGFFEKVLLVSWDLDEVEVRNDDGEIALRCTSFTMTLESTELVISYISGAMSSLGYEELSKEYVRGLANLRYKISPNR
jgi:hypothetical protein